MGTFFHQTLGSGVQPFMEKAHSEYALGKWMKPRKEKQKKRRERVGRGKEGGQKKRICSEKQ